MFYDVEFQPVAFLAEVSGGDGFGENDLIERTVSEFEFPIDFFEGAVPFSEPDPVVVDERGKFDMLRGQGFEDEIAPFGFQLAGCGHGPGQGNPVE